LQNFTEVVTYVYIDKIVVKVPYSTPCPQCRGEILNVKPITRSDTRLGRFIAIIIDYQNMVRLDYPVEEITGILDIVFKNLIKNKSLIKHNNIFLKKIQNTLTNLYFIENWQPANLYHQRLFGKQLN